jgi:hypothetical protein
MERQGQLQKKTGKKNVLFNQRESVKQMYVSYRSFGLAVVKRFTSFWIIYSIVSVVSSFFVNEKLKSGKECMYVWGVGHIRPLHRDHHWSLVLPLWFFFLWLYSPIQALATSMKLSVSLQLLDLGQSVGLLGRVISSSQGFYPYTNTEKRTHNTNTKHPWPRRDLNPRSQRPSERRPLGYRDRLPLWLAIY